MSTPYSGSHTPVGGVGTDTAAFPAAADPYTEASGSTSTGADAPVENQSLGDIVSRISQDFSALMRHELELAKIEMMAEGKKAGKTAGMFGGAAFAGWMAALFLSITLMWLLDKAMDLTLAAFLVFLIWAVAAAVLAARGRQEAREINPKPEQTVETLKEDAQWLKAQKK